MTVKKLYGSRGCLATMRVLASLFEHELDFEFIPIDLEAGDHKKQPFLSLNPFGELPVLQDEDLIVFESTTIMRYIFHHYPKLGKEQVYANPKLQGIAAAWIDVEDHEFEPKATKLIREVVYKPKNGLATDKAVVAEEEAELAKVLDVYEERLKSSKYLGGDKFTAADLTHLPSLYYLMGTPLKSIFDDRPNVSAWCAAILTRPAWTMVVEMVQETKP
ncbi:hypothetical protein ACOSQ2_000387 [Xanthoceras sorbifolium]